MFFDGKRTKLKQADIRKVDFVQAGAQPDAKISIFKSVDGEEEIDLTYWEHANNLQSVMKSIIDGDSENKPELIQGALDQFSADVITSISEDTSVEKAGKKLSAQRMNALKECMKQLANLIADAETEPPVSHDLGDGKIAKPTTEPKECSTDSCSGGKDTDPQNKINKKVEGSENKMAEINKSELSQDVQDYIADLESKVAKSAVPVVEDIYKGLPEAIAKKLKDQDDQLKASNEQIAKMRDESDNKIFIAKAAELTCNLGVKAEEFGPVLKAINASSPEIAEKIEAVLKAANEAVKQGDLFTELGENTPVAPTGIAKSDAWSQIETLAAGKVTKGESTSTASAIDEVLKSAEGRRLYAIYTGKIKG